MKAPPGLINLAFVLVTVCAGCSKPAQPVRPSVAVPTAPVAAEPDQLAPVAVAEFNQEVLAAQARKEAWTDDPVQVALRFTADDWKRPEEWEFHQRHISLQREGPKVSVTVTTTGFHDDSIEGEKFVLVLQKTAHGAWNLASASKGWRCWPERGHTNYSTVRCN